jgi:dihydrodipicolinate synthase/N-acetylneuraminate lyase
LRGAFPVLPTPLTAIGGLDLGSMKSLVERLRDHQLAGLTVLGSGGELPYLTLSEREDVVRAVRAAAPESFCLIVGLACFGTVQAVDEARRMVAAGADALAVALPQYYPTPIDGIIGHYDAIAGAVEIPILYYHFPSVTHLRISQDDFVRLAERVPIAGTKESGLSTPELRRRVAKAPRPLSIFTGISFNMLDALNVGAAGVICPVGVLMPDTTAQLLLAHATAARDQASTAQERLRRAIPLMGGGGLPEAVARFVFLNAVRRAIPLPQRELPHAGIKSALAALGVITSDSVRPPQVGLTAGRRARVAELARELQELSADAPSRAPSLASAG